MTSLGQLATLSEKLSLQCSPVLLPYLAAGNGKPMQTEATGTQSTLVLQVRAVSASFVEL